MRRKCPVCVRMSCDTPCLQELAKQQTAYRNLIMRHASTPAGQLAAASAAGAAAPMPLPLPFILIQVRAGWRPGCMPS